MRQTRIHNWAVFVGAALVFATASRAQISITTNINAAATMGMTRLTRTPVHPDAEDRVQFAALPQGYRYRMDVAAPGYSHFGVVFPEDSTRTNRLDFLVGSVVQFANLKLAGQVLDADGEPVAGITVNISDLYQPYTNTQTDASGHFAFEVCEGDVHLDARMPVTPIGTSSIPSRRGGFAQARGGDTNVVIRLDDYPTTMSGLKKVTGTVFGPSGAPAPSVAVSLLQEGRLDNSRSDTNGKFAISWLPRGHPATIPTPPLLAATAPSPAVPVSPSSRPGLTLPQRPVMPALPGQTPSAPAVRVAGAQPPQPALPEPPPAEARRLLVGRDVEHNLAATLEIGGKTTNAEIHLRPGLTLSVKVLDEKGKPIPRAEALLFLTSPFDVIDKFTEAGEPGVFEIKGLPQEQNYYAMIMATGYRTAHLEAKTGDTRTNHFSFPDVVLRLADQKLAGRVLGEDGAPVPKVRVDVQEDNQPSRTANTDENGQFTFGSLSAGTIKLSALKVIGGKFIRANTQALAGETNVVIRLAVKAQAGAIAKPLE